MGDGVKRAWWAFEQAAGLGAAEQGYLHMAKNALQLYGRELVAMVRDDERVALGLPIQPIVDGKARPGALLLLDTAPWWPGRSVRCGREPP